MNTGTSRTDAHLAAIAQTTSDVLLTVDADGYIQYVNSAVEETLGYAPEELTGRPLTRIVTEEREPDLRAAIDQYLATETGEFERASFEVQGIDADGTVVPLEIAIDEFQIGEDPFLAAVIRDLTERTERIEELEVTNELWKRLARTTSTESATEIAVEMARTVLDQGVVSIEGYSSETGTLEPVARRSASEMGTDPIADLVGEAAWDAFTDQEPVLVQDQGGTDQHLQSALIMPLGRHGVFVTGSPESGSMPKRTVILAELITGAVTTTFDRIESEESLAERETELTEQSVQLERVGRVNELIRSVTKALVTAESRQEIKSTACETLAESETYTFACYGVHDRRSNVIRAAASAGEGTEYLETVTVRTDDETEEPPAARAVRTGERVVVDDLQANPPLEPWREAATDQGFRSCVAVPVHHHDQTYGVLTLYASEPHVVSEMEATVLSELGAMFGYALNSMERYDALVSEESIELEFEIRDTTEPLYELLSQHDGEFQLERIRRREGDSVHIFATFDGIDYATIQSAAGDYEDVESISLVREEAEETVVEITLAGESLIPRLLARGAIPIAIRATPTRGIMTIRLARSASVRDLVEFFEATYAEVDLKARRLSPEPVQTDADFRRSYLEQLTDRQQHVLQTAYFAGYFEQPRRRSGHEIAELLEISQPTFSRHIRAREAELLDLLFSAEE